LNPAAGKGVAQLLSGYASLVDAALDDVLRLEAAPEPLADAMRYGVLAGGKRLRPILALLACEMTGSPREWALTPACALELVHAYSLIHDDLPCMDDADMRRGKPANHIVHGQAMAVLAGDALQALAFEILCAPQPDGYSPELSARLAYELACAAGPTGMVGGQALDIQGGAELPEGHSPLDNLRRMHGMKTGALFRAALRMGCLAGGGSESLLRDLTAYAASFGLAYQIVDDILDVAGDQSLLGKPLGADERGGRLTYPAVAGPDGARELADLAVSDGLSSLAAYGDEAEGLRTLIRYIGRREA